jgi:hypothetical protein
MPLFASSGPKLVPSLANGSRSWKIPGLQAGKPLPCQRISPLYLLFTVGQNGKLSLAFAFSISLLLEKSEPVCVNVY